MCSVSLLEWWNLDEFCAAKQLIMILTLILTAKFTDATHDVLF